MIKRLFILLLFLLPCISRAEIKMFKTGGRIHFQYGLNVGYNLNYFIYKNHNQKDIASGYQGGLFVRVSRSRVFVQLDLDYMHSKVFIKNGTLTTRFGNNIPFDKLTFRYNTIGIPIVLGGLVVKKPSYKMRLYTGLEVDLVTKIKAQYTQNNIDFTSSLRKKDKRDLIRPAQFSYQMGMGMDVAMFIMDFRYNLGFRNFYKEQYRTQTHLFQTTVGVIF